MFLFNVEQENVKRKIKNSFLDILYLMDLKNIS